MWCSSQDITLSPPWSGLSVPVFLIHFLSPLTPSPLHYHLSYTSPIFLLSTGSLHIIHKYAQRHPSGKKWSFFGPSHLSNVSGCCWDLSSQAFLSGPFLDRRKLTYFFIYLLHIQSSYPRDLTTIIHPSVDFFFFVFLGSNLWHMEVPRLGVELELWLSAYATATATPDPSWVCILHHNSWQHWILKPLSEAKDWTCVLMDPSQIHFHWTTMVTPIPLLKMILAKISTLANILNILPIDKPNSLFIYLFIAS